MRIIAGKYKSRHINIPKTAAGKNAVFPLRPTSDRARETVFDVLSNYIEFEKTRCLDLFAGTGGMGLEAISRGADSCIFVDVSKDALTSIEKTAVELGCYETVDFIREKALKFLEEIKPAYFDVIFADPPYDFGKYEILAEKVLVLKPQIFVMEISSALEQVFSAEVYDIIEKKSGSAKFIIFILK